MTPPTPLERVRLLMRELEGMQRAWRTLGAPGLAEAFNRPLDQARHLELALLTPKPPRERGTIDAAVVACPGCGSHVSVAVEVIAASPKFGFPHDCLITAMDRLIAVSPAAAEEAP